MMLSSCCFAQLFWTRCDHLIQDQTVFFPFFASFQIQCMLEVRIFDSFKFCFMSSQNLFSKPAPNILPMQCGWIPTFVAPSLCQIHRHYSVSGVNVLLSRCNYFLVIVLLIMPCCHVTYTKLRLRPKPFYVNKLHMKLLTCRHHLHLNLTR